MHEDFTNEISAFTINNNTNSKFIKTSDPRLNDENPDSLQYHIPCILQLNGILDERVFDFNVGLFTENLNIRDSENEVRIVVRDMIQKNTKDTISFPCIAYYKTTRLYDSPMIEGESPIDTLTTKEMLRNEAYTGCFDAAISLRRLRSWLDRQARVEYEEGKETVTSITVRNSMSAMLEDAIDIRFRSLQLDIVITFKNGNKRKLQQLIFIMQI